MPPISIKASFFQNVGKKYSLKIVIAVKHQAKVKSRIEKWKARHQENRVLLWAVRELMSIAVC